MAAELWLLVAQPMAHAKPRKPTPAQLHVAEGRRLLEAGDFQGAVRELEAASREQNSDPAMWFDMGVALQHLGRDAEAMDALQKFIVLADAAPASKKHDAQLMMADLDAKLTAAQPPSALVTAPAAAPAASRFARAKWIAGGATVVLGAATVAMGLSTRSRYHALRDGCGATPARCSDAAVDGLDTRILLTNLLLGLTAASAVTSGTLFVLDARDGHKEVSVAWRF